MGITRRTSIALLASVAVVPATKFGAFAQGSAAKSPPRNPFLSAEKYGTTHLDPSQSDAFSYPAPRGVFRVDLRKAARVPGGPIEFITLASTSPQYMWAASTGGVSYVDIANDGFRAVAKVATPGTKDISIDALDKLLSPRFTDVAQIEKALAELGLIWTRIASNVYMFVDNDNIFYASSADGKFTPMD